MTALGVTGNPADWQHAADTIGSVVVRLADELAEADARGGSGLRGAWYGPVAEAHAELWHRRHGHYHDLLYQAGRAAHALADFASQLWGLQMRAANLESHWLGHRLHLTSDGTRFTLPSGWESLEHETQALLHARLAESVRDIEAMWRDIEHAVGDLLTILASVTDALADFAAIEVSVVIGAVDWAAKGVVDGYRKDPLSLGRDVLETEADIFKHQAAHDLKVAKALAKDWKKNADGDVRAAGRSVVRDAESDVKVAGKFDDFAKIGGRVTLAGSALLTLGETYMTARKHGWVDAIEEHAGDWTSLGVGAGLGVLVGGAAIGALVTVGAPVAVAAIGVTVGIGVVALGVGDVAQWYVKHHKDQVSHALTDIGHGVGHAATWGAKEAGLVL